MVPNPDMEEAFVQLVVTHQAALRAYVLSMLPGSPEVDDVIQETNAAVWQKRGAFEIGTNFKAWMFSVARYRIMAFWRDAKRRRESDLPEELLIKLADEAVEEGFEGVEQRYQFLGECIQALRPEDRGLVLRRYLAGVTPRQLANELGRTSNSVRVSLHRIRVMLRHCIRRRASIMEGGLS